jgi:hypothetical protein
MITVKIHYDNKVRDIQVEPVCMGNGLAVVNICDMFPDLDPLFTDKNYVLLHIEDSILLDDLFRYQTKYRAINIFNQVVHMLDWNMSWRDIKQGLNRNKALRDTLCSKALLSDDARRYGCGSDDTYIGLVLTAMRQLNTDEILRQLSYRRESVRVYKLIEELAPNLIQNNYNLAIAMRIVKGMEIYLEVCRNISAKE